MSGTFNCGHSFDDSSLTGDALEREMQIQANRHTDCPACLGHAQNYADLEGSEKQVFWAMDIRREKIKLLVSMEIKSGVLHPQALEMLKKFVLSQKKASWWIARRFDGITSILKEMIGNAKK